MSISALFTILTTMGGQPIMTDSVGAYCRYHLADSCYAETYNYGDSTLVVHTICAPICSSYATMYDEQGNILHSIPNPSGLFPEASIVDGAIRWVDNKNELLDEEEKK